MVQLAKPSILDFQKKAIANGGFVRISVTRPSKMLHGARMSGLVKLQRATRSVGQSRQRADSTSWMANGQ